MELFSFTKADNINAALAAGKKGSRFIAGGTLLYDLMKLDVERPGALVDINHLPLDKIERTSGGGLKIGALARNSDVAYHPDVAKDYAGLSRALLEGASAQIRNRASTAGNLLQRTRCVYFRETEMPCNKREPGSGCSALDGYHRNLAILGTSEMCIASNPSDQNVALMALGAIIHMRGSKGERSVPITEFYLLPGSTPQRETILEPGELITYVELPPLPSGTKSLYLKLRDRASYEFALASTAVFVLMKNGRFEDVRLAMGGVGTIPWRAKEAETLLKGQTPDSALFQRAAEATFKNAVPRPENAFKIELGRRCMVRALTLATKEKA
jgi:xanthine dehydrogenase YagS FAD-binding subunit